MVPESVAQPLHYYRQNVAKSVELVAAFQEVADRPLRIRETQRRPGDSAGSYTRTERARRLLGWTPELTVADGIRHSLLWAAKRDQVLGAE